MRRLSPLFGAFALAGLSATAQAAAPANPRGEEQLARLLAGRVAEKPDGCIQLRGASTSSRIIDGTAVVFGDGPVIYVNRPSNPQSLRSGDVITFATSLSQLCRVDIVRTLDPATFIQNGIISLNDFVPYRRLPKG